MLILITGGSGSGKSALAEKLIRKLPLSAHETADLYYAATMQVGNDPENIRRVQRHQLQRQGLGFKTLEAPVRLADAYHAVRNAEPQPKAEAIILLECLSNLLANEMFQSGGVDMAMARQRIETDLAILIQETRHLVVVSNEVFSDSVGLDEMTLRYIAELGALNQWLASRADSVVEAVFGLPVIHRDQNNQVRDWLCS